MSKKPFIPPIHIDIPEDGIKHLSADSKKEQKMKYNEFKKSLAYKKYVEPVIKRDKSMKKSMRSLWLKNNWINILTLIVAVITLVFTILSWLLPK